jgi:ABC-type transporter Mla subunit MlaD
MLLVLLIVAILFIVLVTAKFDGVAKSPSYGVAALFQDFDILYVCLHP